MENPLLCRYVQGNHLATLGISGKSQMAFAVVFSARYLDLFTSFISVYNSVAKVVFIVSSYATLYLMYLKFRATYDSNHDTFRLELLVIPCAILALIINHQFSIFEVIVSLTWSAFFRKILWTFSIYLESVAILPQLFLISKTGEAETITSHYLFALGSYRALYILNWIYRYSFEGYFDYIAVVAGVVQTLLYLDFFYLYVTRGRCQCWVNFIVLSFLVLKGRRLSLPAWNCHFIYGWLSMNNLIVIIKHGYYFIIFLWVWRQGLNLPHIVLYFWRTPCHHSFSTSFLMLGSVNKTETIRKCVCLMV